MEKIVVLNSGGFDSVVLMNDVRGFLDPEADIYSLHFLYGAPNEKMQKKCVKKVCKKVGAHYKEIRLPKFDWTKHEFYTKGKDIYVEGRNYIFLAYALSYAESIGAKKIYLATLKSVNYVDTSLEFLKYADKIAKLFGVNIIAPYSTLDKIYLLPMATTYGVTKDDFFSCDAPNHGKPCHKCNECLMLEDFYNNDIPVKAFARSGNNLNDATFRKLLFNTKIKEVRLLINNLCQLKCEHCFYGFEEMKSPQLSIDEMKEVIRKCALEFGGINFHFSGKEPFFNEDIFEYAKYIRNNFPFCTYDVVTNGFNISKYIDKIKEAGFRKIFLSYDDFSEASIRKFKSEESLKLLEEAGIDTEIFIDLHSGNVHNIKDGINALKEYKCIHNFYIRTIKSIGNAEDRELLSLNALEEVYNALWDLAEENQNVRFYFNIGSEYAYQLRSKNYELSHALEFLEGSFSIDILPNFAIYAERYCARYEGTISITPDGYVLGCATEVSNPNYDLLSAGNVRDYDSLKELVQKGIKESLALQNTICVKNGIYCLKKCPHTLNCINNSDNIKLG